MNVNDRERHVPIKSIKHLIIRFYELQSSIFEWKVSLKEASSTFSKVERESIKETIRVETLQLMALKEGLPLIFPDWELVEISDSDKEDYRLKRFENEKAFQKSNFANDELANLMQDEDESKSKNSIFIPPKSVYVVPISEHQHSFNKMNAEPSSKTFSNIPSKFGVLQNIATSTVKRRVRDKTPEIQQAVGDFPPWKRPLFTRIKNWIPHFKFIESLFLEFSLKSDEEKSVYLKETIDPTLHATLCYHENNGRLLHVSEMNQRGVSLFGPNKDAPHFCNVHGFGMHITGDCNESKKKLSEISKEVMEEGVVAGTIDESNVKETTQITIPCTDGNNIQDDSLIENKIDAEISYCKFCFEKNGLQVESSYDHMFEFHFASNKEESEDEPNPLGDIHDDVTKEEDYGWRRNNYYKGKTVIGGVKERDNYGRPINKKSRSHSRSPNNQLHYRSSNNQSYSRSSEKYPNAQNDRGPRYEYHKQSGSRNSLPERGPSHHQKPYHRQRDYSEEYHRKRDYPPDYHRNLASMISSLDSQSKEIKELDYLLENFEELWNEKLEMSAGQHNLFDRQEYQKLCAQSEEERQELENILFSRRLLWTKWKLMRNGIKSEREGEGAILNDRLAWNAYKELELAEEDGGPLDMVSDTYQNAYQNTHQTNLENGGNVNYHADFNHPPSPDCDFNNDEYEEVVEELGGQSVCMVHGICDHVTSQCAEAVAMLQRDQYYFSRCDPRLSQNIEKKELCKIPKYVPDYDEGRSKIRRSDLITYEENRTVYNFL